MPVSEVQTLPSSQGVESATLVTVSQLLIAPFKSQLNVVHCVFIAAQSACEQVLMLVIVQTISSSGSTGTFRGPVPVAVSGAPSSNVSRPRSTHEIEEV